MQTGVMSVSVYSKSGTLVGTQEQSSTGANSNECLGIQQISDACRNAKVI